MAGSQQPNGGKRSADQPPEAPPRAGRYEYVSLIADGAFGPVWRARVVSGAEIGRAVAIRRIARQGLTEAQVEQLASAGFSAMEVRHPKIAAVLDVVVGEDEIAVVSELVPGVRMRDLLGGQLGKGPPCPPEAALRIVADLLEALSAAKQEWSGIYGDADSEAEKVLSRCVHGGLLPDSVLVATFGETMLTDLGIAGAAVASSALGERADVLPYRAPEHLDGVFDEVGDVFVAGIFLWELIANRSLFAPAALPRPDLPRPTGGFAAAAQLSAIKKKLTSAAIPRLATLPKYTGEAKQAVSDLVARALQRPREARFQSLSEMHAAIVALGQALGTEEKVAAFVEGIGSSAGDDTPEEPGRERVDSVRDTVPPVSNRPTVPPISDRATVPPSGMVQAEVLEALPTPEAPGVRETPYSAPPISIEPESLEPMSAEALSLPDAPAVAAVPSPPAGAPTPPRPPPPPPPSSPTASSPTAAFSLDGLEPSNSHTDLTASHALLTELAPKRSGFPLKFVLAGGAAVVLVAAGLVFALGGRGEEKPSPLAPPARVEPAATAPAESAAPAGEEASPSAPSALPEPEPAPEPEPEPEPAVPAPPSPLPPPQTKRFVPAAPRPPSRPAPAPAPPATPSTSKPDQKKPFRPSGI